MDRALEAIVRCDRALALTGLVGVTLIAWLDLIGDAAPMAAMPTMAMPGGQVRPDLPHMAMMMIGVMVPSAAPVILLYARVVR